MKSSHIIRLSSPNVQELHAALSTAVEVIASGGTVVVPTDTVFGIAANALDESAIAAVYRIKGRDSNAPLPVHVASVADLHEWARDMSEPVRCMAERLLPGPLTIVLKKSARLPDAVTGGCPTVGMRVPDHPVTLALLQLVGRPLVMTSANLSGMPPITTGSDACAVFNGRVDCIVDGDEVPDYRCREGIASTVIDATCLPPRILRRGSISDDVLRQFLPDIQTVMEK